MSCYACYACQHCAKFIDMAAFKHGQICHTQKPRVQCCHEDDLSLILPRCLTWGTLLHLLGSIQQTAIWLQSISFLHRWRYSRPVSHRLSAYERPTIVSVSPIGAGGASLETTRVGNGHDPAGGCHEDLTLTGRLNSGVVLIFLSTPSAQKGGADDICWVMLTPNMCGVRGLVGALYTRVHHNQT